MIQQILKELLARAKTPEEKHLARMKARALGKLEKNARPARHDPIRFNEHVYRTETGGRIELAPFQRNWLDAIQSSKRTLIFAPPEHGKTVNLSFLYPLWELGNDSSKRVVVVQNTARMAEKVTMVHKAMIDSSFYSLIHQVFPNLTPATTAAGQKVLWRQDALKIAGKKQPRDISVFQMLMNEASPAKDFSLQSSGEMGRVDGSRFDLVIIDDLLSFENTRTQAQRDKIHEWLLETLFNRVTKNGKIVWLTNAWHIDDAAHRESRKGTWTVIRDQAVNPEFASTGEIKYLLWPEVWDEERLADKLEEVGPVVFLRKYCNQAFDETTRLFKAEWIANALRRGRGLHFEHHRINPNLRATGWDLGTRKKKTSDLTSGCTIEAQQNQDRLLVNLEAGKFDGAEIVEKVKDHHERYDSLQIVEDNAAQKFILDFTREDSDALVTPFTTGSNKWDETHGVVSLSVELYNGKWILPSGEWNGDDRLTDLSGLHPEIQALVTEMLSFNTDDHTGDRLMSAWFAREGVRKSRAQRIGFDALRR